MALFFFFLLWVCLFKAVTSLANIVWHPETREEDTHFWSWWKTETELKVNVRATVARKTTSV